MKTDTKLTSQERDKLTDGVETFNLCQSVILNAGVTGLTTPGEGVKD